MHGVARDAGTPQRTANRDGHRRRSAEEDMVGLEPLDEVPQPLRTQRVRVVAEDVVNPGAALLRERVELVLEDQLRGAAGA